MADKTTGSKQKPVPPRMSSDDLKNYPHLLPDRFSHIFKIDETTVVKYGRGEDRISEASTMRFIREMTDIPLPDVIDAYLDTNNPSQGMLVMSFIEGNILEDVWSTMNSAQKASIIAQLRGYISQLRQLKGSRIGKIDGTACEDSMFDNDQGVYYGPYDNEVEFNNGIVAALQRKAPGIFVDMVSDMVRSLQNHEIVMTHADLVPRNIIVRDDKVVGILDWEMSGFWPSYWEYIKALHMPDWVDSWIKERVTDQIMDAYHLEHAVLRQVRDVWW